MTSATIETMRSVKRVAMPVMHSCPLRSPGEGDAGGMNVYVKEIATALAARGVGVDIFTRRTDAATPTVTNNEGVRVIHVDAGELDLGKDELASVVPAFTSNILTWAQQSRATYDAIHSHYWLSGRTASVLHERWDIPFVHTFHTLGHVKNRALRPDDLSEPEHRLDGELKVVKEACAIVASTPEERSSLVDFYAAAANKIHLVAPGVNHRTFVPGNREAAKHALDLADKHVVLFAGRLQPLKAADTALRALAHLIKTGKVLADDIRLLVVGGASGPSGSGEPARLRHLAHDLGVSTSTVFVDAQPQWTLPSFYHAADVCIVPSHSESFGLVALEAHACGVPVVGAEVSGLKAIVRPGQSGYLVSPYDTHGFADKIWRILSNPALGLAMSQAAIAAASHFSWDRAAGELHDLYSSPHLMAECGATA